MTEPSSKALPEGFSTNGCVLDTEAVKRLLPHRYPFLMVDRVVSCEPGKSIQAIKNVTINEPCFQGHFPRCAIMPGVLIIEAMAQVSALLGHQTVTEPPPVGAMHLLAGVDKVRFKMPVVPGDRLLLEARLVTRKGGIWKFSTTAKVGERMAARAELLTTLSE